MLVPNEASEAGGPKTEEGKEVVRWNAIRHGIRSPRSGRPQSGEGRGVGGSQRRCA